MEEHAKIEARRLNINMGLVNNVSLAAEQAASEYIAERGLDTEEDYTEKEKERYIEYFKDEIRYKI